MKNKIGFIVLSTLIVSQTSHAGPSCRQDRQQADQTCSKEKVAAANKEIALCEQGASAKTGAGVTGGTSVPAVVQCKDNMLPMAMAQLREYVSHCEKARDRCISSCQTDHSQDNRPPIVGGNPAEAANDKESETYCKEGEPKKNEDDAKKSQMDIGQAIAGLAALLAALGQGETDKTDTAENCTTNPSLPQCIIDKGSTPGDTSIAVGQPRTIDGGSLADGSSLPGMNDPAMGEAGQAQLSAAIPGNAPGGGMGMGPGGGFAGANLGTASKKDEEGASKISLGGQSGGGGGGGGGGGMMGGGRGGGAGTGVASTRSGSETEKGIAAGLEKAGQQRGLASDGPAGGISSAHSLDNFQKVEKRIQSERNQLNEL